MPPRRVPPARPSSRRARPVQAVDQFLIVLGETDPLVWRRIQVPTGGTFWDLHVAIQDAMGWLDCHLHEFAIGLPDGGDCDRIGIPDDEGPTEQRMLPGWEVLVGAYFRPGLPPALYTYDFGDDWHHMVMFEGTWPAKKGRYPRCLAGARACPPDDCGGIPGYRLFLDAVANAAHPEHASMLEWVGGRFDPDGFRPDAVAFSDPKVRLRLAFKDE